MIEYVKMILTGQFEAALCMMDQCIRVCPPEHWEGKIANGTFRWVAYHTLFWVDLYLSPGDEVEFVLRDFHHRGGDERENAICLGLSKDETLSYVQICRKKMLDTMAGETAESLQGPCGFSYRKITRGELHVYNLRHVQHHTGQLSAYLRRVDPALCEPEALPWIGTGWRGK
jgi:DinB superfamily